MLHIEENVLLSQHTTFRIGGKARYFIRITDKRELPEALRFIKESGLPHFILGAGSNLLISDEGINGTVLKLETKGISCVDQGTATIVTAEAGENWDDVVRISVEKGLSGIEHLSWIPGLVGAAPVQNIGAYGTEFKDVCDSVDAINIQTGEEKTFSKEENHFAYRNSFWKSPEGKAYLVTRVRMKLQASSTSTAEYKDIRAYFEEAGGDITPSAVREAVIQIRKNKLPDVAKLGTAGSFFKNPIISAETYEALRKKYPLLPKFDTPNGEVKIPAAWILDMACHLKGFRSGSVGLYEKQPLAIVNFSNATGKDIFSFAEIISKKFSNATGIDLEWEVEKVGRF